ncbi:MAG: hypothetical protein IKH52_03580 [Bacteroidaceae bacterium]|nr:hypothetical protein [Bacteroidaceae bacterium]MBR6926275.1 hypothetical protein [Bacteroidaceae bacterium]
MGNHILGGILCLIAASLIGYLLASLCSWSFSPSEWNIVSDIIKWITIIIDGLILSDLFRNPYNPNS